MIKFLDEFDKENILDYDFVMIWIAGAEVHAIFLELEHSRITIYFNYMKNYSVLPYEIKYNSLLEV